MASPKRTKPRAKTLAAASLDRLYDLIVATKFGVPDPIPPGWHCAKEIAVKMGCGVRHASRRMNVLAQRGLVEHRKYRVAGQATPVTFYHEKEMPQDNRKKIRP